MSTVKFCDHDQVKRINGLKLDCDNVFPQDKSVLNQRLEPFNIEVVLIKVTFLYTTESFTIKKKQQTNKV